MELKECPFCGSYGELFEKTCQRYAPSGEKIDCKYIYHYVECSGCGLMTSTRGANENYIYHDKLKQEVIDQWNKIAEALEVE